MATTKKKITKAAPTTVKKKTVKKAAPKKAPAKTAAPKKAPAKTAVAKKASPKDTRIKVTLEQRHKMICEAAYYISLEKTYDTVSPTEDWLQAEAAINQIVTVHSS